MKQDEMRYWPESEISVEDLLRAYEQARSCVERPPGAKSIGIIIDHNSEWIRIYETGEEGATEYRYLTEWMYRFNRQMKEAQKKRKRKRHPPL